MAAITYYALLASTQAGDKQTDTQMGANLYFCVRICGCERACGRERERERQRERKDRRANLPGLLLVRQIFSRWGGSAGEGKARLGGWGGSRGSANTFRKQKYITVHVSRKMSRGLTGRAEGRGGEQ